MAYGVSRGGMDPRRIHVIPRELADHGGDGAVLAWVEARDPDLVGFTCSMWNLRRNAWLAGKIRTALPRTRTLAGGPEIAPGQPVLSDPVFDALVLGEGERAFLEVLRDLRGSGRLRRLYREGPLLALDDVPNPYLAGTMERLPHDPLYLETVRGCAHRCSYCFYGKSYPGLRFFPRRVVREIFPWARAHGVPEIYVMDPSFTGAPRWEERLRLMASLNESRIPLHTEIRLEAVTDDRRADLFAEAGFRSVEAGLQSTNARALKAVNRSWRREAFLRGARLLRERGIVVKTGIILGLPEDGTADFAATLDFLAESGLSRDAEIYPLSVLPGTVLRKEAAARGIRFLSWPPYWVLSTPNLSESDMRASIREAEGRFGIDFFPPVPPHFRDECGGFAGFIDLRRQAAFEETRAQPQRLANSLTLLLAARQLRIPGFGEALGAWFLRVTPNSLFQVVVESDSPLAPEDEDMLGEAFHEPGHWFNQAHLFSPDPQGRFSVRLFRLAKGSDAAAVIARSRAAGETADLVMRAGPRLLEKGRPTLRAEMPFLLVERGMDGRTRRRIENLYRCHERLLLEADRPV